MVLDGAARRCTDASHFSRIGWARARHAFPVSSKGRTRDFESLNRGSNPCTGTKHHKGFDDVIVSIQSDPSVRPLLVCRVPSKQREFSIPKAALAKIPAGTLGDFFVLPTSRHPRW